MSSELFRSPQDPIYIPPMGPDAVTPPDSTLYETMGEAGIIAMLRAFYEELGRSSLAGMFADDREQAAYRSAMFFVGLLGGPPLYAQKYGPPRMRARHLPFRITPAYQQIWLSCFEHVLTRHQEFDMPAESVASFRNFLEGFSAWMVNTAEPTTPPSR